MNANALTEWGVVGVLVTLIGLISVVVKWTNDSNAKSNELQKEFSEHWADLSRNLAENTLAINELRFYLDKVETDLERRLSWHENVLNSHEEKIGVHSERLAKLEAKERHKKEE